MHHKKDIITIGAHECTFYVPTLKSEHSPFILIQPVDTHDLEALDKEVAYMESHSDANFILVAFRIMKWNDELTPWAAPPVFGKRPFNGDAASTLLYIKSELAPYLTANYTIPNQHSPIIIGGYSLAGLFTLWTAYQTDYFSGVVAASPSVWYPNWLKYAETHNMKIKTIYLSIGDKESHTQTEIMKNVDNDIRKLSDILKTKGTTTTLEWNIGNHFQDSGERTAKGFLWVMEKLSRF